MVEDEKEDVCINDNTSIGVTFCHQSGGTLCTWIAICPFLGNMLGISYIFIFDHCK
jgi:hypothetical protein